jgi:MFS transporter, PPP family, 3-phenylpropionic acid transporter
MMMNEDRATVVSEIAPEKGMDKQWTALGMTVYLATFSAAIYSIFLGSFLSRRGLDRELVGFVGAAGSAAMITGNLVWGYLSDWSGRRRSLILGASLASIPTLLLWLPATTWQEYAGLNAINFFLVVPSTSLLAVLVLDLLSPAARAQRFGLFRMWGSAGLLSASWGAGWFLRSAPDRMFIFAAVSIALAMIPFALGTREAPRPRTTRFHFGHVLRNRRILLFYFCTLLHGVWEPGCFLFLSYSLIQKQAGEGLIGIILGLNGLVAIVSLPLAGRLADRWGRRPMLVSMYFITGARMILYSVAGTPLSYVPIQLLHFGSFGISEAVGSVYVSEQADQRDRATALACFHLFHSIGATLGSIGGGIIASAYGFPVMYRVFALVVALAGVVFGLALRSDRNEAPVRTAEA